VFKGNTDGMKDNVFQCHGENTDKQQFLKTVGVLGELINKTFTYPQDVASVCKSFKLTALVQPANLSEEEYETNMGKKMIWETSMKNYMKRIDLQESNKRAIYAIVWGQSSTMMQSKIESLEECSSKSIECDCIWLLKEIQGLTHRFEGSRNIFISLDDAWARYYTHHQTQHQSLHDYHKDYQSLVQVLEHYGASIGTEGPYLEYVKDKVKEASSVHLTDEDVRKRSIIAAKQQSIAMGFMKRADKRRYGALWSNLENTPTISPVLTTFF
jgi:hypothetical protein